jgi:hypothetical protein
MGCLLWAILFALSWPVALLFVVLYPFVWIIMLPFRFLGFAVESVFQLLRWLILLPTRLIP